MPTYSFDFGPDLDRLLNDLSSSKHLPKGEIIRRALALYKYLDQKTRGYVNVSQQSSQQANQPFSPPAQVAIVQGDQIVERIELP